MVNDCTTLPELPPIPESERTPLVDALVTIVELLKEENRLLRKEQALLKEENVLLRKENAELRERIARLEKNSSNSSKPPSSDITKPADKQRQPGKRKIGGQPGHKGHWRRSFLAEEIGCRRHVSIRSCPDCHAPLESRDTTQVVTQAELVRKPVVVTEYTLHEGYCRGCQKTVTASLPEGVVSGQMMGPRLVSLFGYMKAAMGVSIREIKEFSRDVLAVRFSDSSVQNAVFQVPDAISPVYDEIRRALPDQKALNIDETGWKEQGSRHWVWVFCNSCLAVFVISKSRGCAVLEEMLGKNFLGALTSDFFSAYVKYASPKQQFCLAHLIRDMKFLTTLPSPEANAFGIKLLAFMRRVFKLWHGRHEFSDTEWKKKSSRFLRDFDRYLFAQRFDKGSPARTLKRRILRHSRSLWRFLDEPSLYEPTNNHAERTIRHLVRLRRISQGSRGSSGSRWTERAASVLATARLQKKNAWNVFLDAVNARYFGHLHPSLAYP